MPEAIQIKNQLNNSILRYKFGKKNVNLALINGKNMRGISVPYTSVLERTPIYDFFVKSSLNNGFTMDHIDDIEILAILNNLSNLFENGERLEDFGLEEDY